MEQKYMSWDTPFPKTKPIRCAAVSNEWPRRLPALTDEQRKISDDFMRHWHEVLSSSPAFSMLENFNHNYAVRRAPKSFTTTLEIGAGLGEHLKYERLSEKQLNGYVALELRKNMVERIRERFPQVRALQGDCQSHLDFPDNHFDRILAIHVLEHLPNLPACIREMHRLCNKNSGVFSVVIPCEGGTVYSIARWVSSQRIFEKRYKTPYRWFMEQEHLSTTNQIIEELKKKFEIEHVHYFPLGLPSCEVNLCVGLTLRPIRSAG